MTKQEDFLPNWPLIQSFFVEFVDWTGRKGEIAQAK